MAISFKWQQRISRFWRWIAASRWPLVLKRTYAAREKTFATQRAADAATAARALAELREEMAPVFDKLVSIQAGVVNRIPTMKGWIAEEEADFTSAFDVRSVDARMTYRVCVDIAEGLVEYALIQGQSKAVIHEIAKRAEYLVERELKTMNFRRFQEKQ